MESSLFTEYKLDKTRLRYYFDKFKYRCAIRIKGVHFIRVCNFDSRRAIHCGTYMTYLGGKKSTWNKAIEDNHDLILLLCDWVGSNKKDRDNIKISLSYNNLSIYYNDESKIDGLLKLIESNTNSQNNHSISFTRSGKIENFERGVVYLTKPKHKYRLYFNFIRLNEEETQYIRGYFRELEEEVNGNYAIKSFLYNNLRPRPTVIYYNSYIDANDDVHATYLNLFKPGIIYRVAKIEQRINSIDNGE